MSLTCSGEATGGNRGGGVGGGGGGGGGGGPFSTFHQDLFCNSYKYDKKTSKGM